MTSDYEKRGFPNTCFLTCGDWDLLRMLPRQVALSKVSLPNYMKTWINVKVPFKMYVMKRKRIDPERMSAGSNLRNGMSSSRENV